ncbi:hypothetical protein [Streptomyces sp. STCH 565 A]|uniref:hypothetical protein n=1 Tax=Streptomyces sp. STCH 565 A TaxID=2950532 RepID=UPI002076325A|nr:hypothetical protein [Streptomyces sp. STCH 565 A]MCM8551223.1 hypothetical protein [Streptomyces sp. STCH 565 A]
MRDTGEAGGAVSERELLDGAERAFLRAEYRVARPLLRRLRDEFGAPDAEADAVRSAVLRCALAARTGNWREAVRLCPATDDLNMAGPGVLHALAVSALRRLSDEERPADTGTAALAIVLWAHLLDEDDPGDFRGLLTRRRGAPVPDKDWDAARTHLLGRVTDLFDALDVRAGRDALGAWRTAWEAERLAPVVAAEAGPDDLIPLRHAARQLLRDGRRVELLAAYTRRHPDPAAWAGDAPAHRACAEPVAEAVAEHGRDRVRAGEWSEALADFGTAARLGRAPGATETAAVLHAAKNVGRGRAGLGYRPVTRIEGLELAHALLPQDASVATELDSARDALDLCRRARSVYVQARLGSRNGRGLLPAPVQEELRAAAEAVMDACRAMRSVALRSATERAEDLWKRLEPEVCTGLVTVAPAEQDSYSTTLRQEILTTHDALWEAVARGDQAAQDTQLVRLGHLAEQGRSQFADVRVPSTAASVLPSRR